MTMGSGNLRTPALRKEALKKRPNFWREWITSSKLLLKRAMRRIFLWWRIFLALPSKTVVGREPAAGCLVSYLTYITTVTPIDFTLPFERFLNPHYPPPCNFRLDFADNRRDE